MPDPATGDTTIECTLTPGGCTLSSGGGRVRLASAAPRVTLRTSARGKVEVWAPVGFSVSGDRLTALDGPGGARLDLTCHIEQDHVRISARVTNTGGGTLRVERLSLWQTTGLQVGEDPAGWRMYRNGFQSWAGTATLGMTDRDVDLPARPARIATTDAKHPAGGPPGRLRSDGITAVAEPHSGDALAVGFTTLAEAFGYIGLDASAGPPGVFDAWADLDGIPVPAGESTPDVEVVVTTAHGPDAGWAALSRVAHLTGTAMGARSIDRPHPGGWCSWYYYFTKVTEADVLANLAVLATDGRNGPEFGCEYVMVDDGHQSAIGDWCDTNTQTFPSGMGSVAARITDAGFDAGIWWAPFLVAPRSRVATEHPDWLVRNDRGRPIVGILNPGWGITTPMRVLDTTNPEVLDHLSTVARTIGHEWGYRIQKLDFCYAAALPGRRWNQDLTRARALRMGLDAIRRGAGEDSFLLGCGCPLGPSVGVVDAMRIGADVTPYWGDRFSRFVGRGMHGLATEHAVRNTLTRAVLDGAWWLNDPDCLMVRDTDTRLTLDEVQVMATAFGMTNGMLVLSDDLQQVGAERRSIVARTRALAGGHCRIVDLFERRSPEVIVSEHVDRVDLGVLNLGDRPRPVRIDLAGLGMRVPPSTEPLVEFWTGTPVTVDGGLVDFGVLPPHSARVVSLPARSRS